MSLAKPDTALLFGAGFGTRMAPLTLDRPKPLVEVAEKPLLDHALDILAEGGIEQIAINTHYLAEQIADHLADRPILISHEPEILDTGGGLKQALNLLESDPVLTLNTDAVWTGPNPVKTLLRHWDPDRMEALLLLVASENATGHRGKGDFLMDPEGRLTPGPGAVYTGLQIIRTDRVSQHSQTAFSLWEIWREMLNRGTIFGALHKGGWCDVGRPDSIALAEDLLRRHA